MQHNDKSDIAKIIKLQSLVRSTQTRERYVIQQLRSVELKDYQTFVVGNDPRMPQELDDFIEPNDKIALIATSGMRAVSIACTLGNPNQLPKIFLVDNSAQVTAFWQAMREFMQDDIRAKSKEMFLQNLPQFLSDHYHLYMDLEPDTYKKSNSSNGSITYLSQDINNYFKQLINQHGYDFVRAVIIHTSVIKQSWADEETFRKIKNIANYLGIHKIFMYPSNIVSCLSNQEAENLVLKNIASFSPILSIHTDLCEIHKFPRRVLLITNQEPNMVRSTLFQSANVNQSRDDQTSNKKEIGPGSVVKTTNMQARNKKKKPKTSANSQYYNRHI